MQASPELSSVPWTAWALLFISSFGVFMASVSTTALIIAFPVLLQDLNMTMSTMMWVLLVVLLMLAAVVSIAGKLGDIFGQSHIYLSGYYCFVLGSLGAGFVQKQNQGYDLVACRIVIGFGAALLFTNSSAILTNVFSKYGRVGLSQGIFRLAQAGGTVLGPVIGGAFANNNWPWIFWFNVPPGGICAIAATFILPMVSPPVKRKDPKPLDYTGAFFSTAGLILILIAMVQAVAPNPPLSSTVAISLFSIFGAICGTIFIVDQFYAADPLIPPQIFRNPIFSLTICNGTFMAFVRNSITYNTIFYLQGPKTKTPLEAGLMLIAYGIGVMITGFFGGYFADKVGIRLMLIVGPLIVLAAISALATFNQETSLISIEVTLFIAGAGLGLFQSPNSTANMLSVKKEERGVAAAVITLTMAFSMMVGIVLTFGLVLNAMSQQAILDLFVFGADSSHPISNSAMNQAVAALATDYYILMFFCVGTIVCSYYLPADLNEQLHPASNPTKELPPSSVKDSEEKKDELEIMEEGRRENAMIVSTRAEETV